MNDQRFFKIQAIQLRQLLEQAGDDPILVPQLTERLESVEKELASLLEEKPSLFGVDIAALPPATVLPRAAVFLRGGGVQGSEGIRPALAGEALIQYEKMFTAQALHDEREAAKTEGRQRRRRGASTPSLYFTGTPRGSFGLEFVPQQSGDEATLKVHEQSLQNIARALASVGNSDGTSLEKVLQGIPTRVLQPMKSFLKVLAQHGAELRLAFSNAPSQSVNIENVKRASDLLEREVTEKQVEHRGTFRGVTRETGFFDFNTDDVGTISGTVADNLTEEDLERIDALTNKRCVAQLYETSVQQVSGEAKSSYLLLDAEEEAEPFVTNI